MDRILLPANNVHVSRKTEKKNQGKKLKAQLRPFQQKKSRKDMIQWIHSYRRPRQQSFSEGITLSTTKKSEHRVVLEN